VPTISSQTTIVQASGISGLTFQLQGGKPTTQGTVIAIPGAQNSTGIKTPLPFFSLFANIATFSGARGSTNILERSTATVSGSKNLNISLNKFSGNTSLFGVVGTTGTIEHFFDRSPYFHTPSELDVNTQKDLHEVAKFLVFSTATIASYRFTNHIKSYTSIVTAKGDVPNNIPDPINLVINPSFEQGLAGWKVTSTDGDNVQIVSSQPLGVGFNDGQPVSPVDGNFMAWMDKEQNTGVLQLIQNTRTGQVYSSSQLNGLSFSFAPNTSLGTGAGQLVVDFQFLMNGSPQYEILYRFSGGVDPSPLGSGIVINPTDTFTLPAPTVNVFNTYARHFPSDAKQAVFNFNSFSINVIQGLQPASRFGILLDEFQMTLNQTTIELRRTSSNADILTALPAISGTLPFTISGSANITVIDQTPPFLDQTVPASGTTYNNPNTQVSLHVKDLSSSLNQGTISIFIDGTQVVTAGSPTTGFTWPTIQKIVLTPSDVEYIFTRGALFPQGDLVTVSGNAQDSVGNQFMGQYQFKIQGYANISGTISGSADALPPVLTPTDPINLETNVSPNTALNWTVTDDARGVDPTTVKLTINNALVVNGDSNVTAGTLTRTVVSPVNYIYSYLPNIPFRLGSTVTGTLGASDLAGNVATPLTYTFTIFASDTLFINFFMTAGQTVPITSGTLISGTVTDATYGVNTGATFVTLNGGAPPGLAIAPITNGIQFTIPAQPVVNFQQDLSIFIHAVNNFPGTYPVIKEQTFVLHPGYKVNWYNRNFGNYEVTFPFLSNIQVLTDVDNFAQQAAEASLFTRWIIKDQPKADLPAMIVSNITTADLLAVVGSDNPFFEYGKTITLEIDVADLAGNQLTFVRVFTIQSKTS